MTGKAAKAKKPAGKPRGNRLDREQSGQKRRGRSGWMAPIAVVLLLLVGYAFYFLNHLPETRVIPAGTRWRVDAGEQLRLLGAAAGTALQLNFGEAAAAKLSFPRRTRLLPDPAAGQEGNKGETPLDLNLFNAARENAEIRISLVPERPGERATLMLGFRRPDPRLLTLALGSDEAALRVDLGLVLDPDAEEHGEIQIGDLVLEEAALIVPKGKSFTLGLRTAQLAALRKEVGEYVDGGQRLEVSGVEIGTALEGRLERRSLACGARRGRIMWQRPVPGVGPADCQAGRVAVTGLDLGEGGQVTLQGTGFLVSDGKTETWQGFREFWQNDVVKALMGPVMAGFAAWVLYILRNVAFVRSIRRRFGGARS